MTWEENSSWETKEIFSVESYFIPTEKKEIPKDPLKGHYGYIFTIYLGEIQGSVPFIFLAVLMKIHKPDGIP